MIPIRRAVVPKGLLKVHLLSGITLGKWIAGRKPRLLKESILFVSQGLAGGRVRLSNLRVLVLASLLVLVQLSRCTQCVLFFPNRLVQLRKLWIAPSQLFG